jgi:hypothetical protein
MAGFQGDAFEIEADFSTETKVRGFGFVLLGKYRSAKFAPDQCFTGMEGRQDPLQRQPPRAHLSGYR